MAEVLSVQLSDGVPFSHAPLRRSANSHTSFFDASSSFGASRKSNYSQTDLRSDSLTDSWASSRTSSFRSTPASSLSLDTRFDFDDDDDDALAFPDYSRGKSAETQMPEDPPSSPLNVSRPPPSPVDGMASSLSSPPDPLLLSEDDTAVRVEPSQHVDYLSYEWKEEDIWSSWRHIVTQRKVYGERSRLENASWRTWAKSQFQLKTVSPETLNWLKDCDVTWLYGPLQPASNRLLSQHQSEPVSRLSKNNSFVNKKPILKKRSVSEVMLQKSLSASSLVKQAAAAVQAQQANGAVLERRRHRPVIGRATSDFVTYSLPSATVSRDPTDFSSQSTSGLHTPDQGERRHIRFDDKVEQCIAVDIKEGEDDDDDDNIDSWATRDEDDSSDDGVVMMKRSRKKRPISRNHSRSSFSGESKTIAKLPSTTLKYRTDSPDVTEQQPTHSLGFYRSSRLSPSPSQETLRPSNPSTNFLLPEDDEDEDDDPWEPAGAYEVKRASTPTPSDFTSTRSNMLSAESSESGGLRRTSSGMFMPYDEVDDDPVPPGIIGRVVDTVNTARDIAHVIWNVGWRN
ncbi:hypothetical protein BCR34DRAFT_487197 [Clohesyomyces aquaticus]|uniref:Nitrogen regulatory protein areA GATA-like domain-containing protein n=1 Tax=Clohesyomyces aquaticus TaxID=1231657 RepID=A0A1Y1ZI19_9PLEO|nr:hypothetical protein BCR34DRAFT_487197 [Clohesyomyces aquaticus]